MGAVPASRATPLGAPTRTGRKPWSTWLLRQWSAARHPGVTLLEQFRLGPTSAFVAGVQISPEFERMLRVNNWYADGVLETADEVLIVESKMKPSPGAVGQVQFYLRLAFATPGLFGAMHKPFHAVVLFAENDPAVSAFATAQNCRVEIFSPNWIEEYLQLVQFRNRSTSPNLSASGPS